MWRSWPNILRLSPLFHGSTVAEILVVYFSDIKFIAEIVISILAKIWTGKKVSCWNFSLLTIIIIYDFSLRLYLYCLKEHLKYYLRIISLMMRLLSPNALDVPQKLLNFYYLKISMIHLTFCCQMLVQLT